MQDDWRVRTNLKLTFGLRYEFYDIPKARGNAPLEISRKFNRDTNNFAPRFGLAYSIGNTRKTIFRASAGIFYADGRAIFGTGARPNPDFNNIDITESVGRSEYNAGTFSLNKRFSRGYQLNASYTWSHGIDNAPEINIIDSTEFPADPTNRRFDRGNSLADQRHTFILSSVISPTFDISNRFANALVNGNQFGIIARANSGFRVNVRGNRDLNGDGIATNDRPLFIGRNIETTGTVRQLDLRYSRLITIRESMKIEIIGEFTNIFNIVNVSSVNQVVPVNTDGSLVASTTPNILTTDNKKLIATGGFPQRIFQLGFKFRF